jgi:accessory colonization factor AcfC
MTLMKEIRVYGPGGPYQAFKECCDFWAEKTKLKVRVFKGMPDEWAQEARMMGDLIYFGAENMLEDFVRKFPGIIDSKTVRCPFKRRVGIIVRRFNPHRIGSLADLVEKKARLLVVELEKMDEFFDSVPGVRQCALLTVTTGEEGFAVWQTKQTIDAWVTYRS